MLLQPRPLVPFTLPRLVRHAPPVSYADRVLALSPIAYWKLDETSGTTAFDSSGNGYDGTYSGVTLNAATAPDGSPAPAFDGVNDFVNVYGTGFASAFNHDEGTLLVFAKVANSGVWTDGTLRRIASFAVNNSNRVIIWKNSTANQVEVFYVANNVSKSVTRTGASFTDFFPVAITWSKSADQVRMYVSGSQNGSTQTGLGSWTGSLATTLATIGATSTSGNNPFHGSIAHVAVFDYALNASQIADVAVAA